VQGWQFIKLRSRAHLSKKQTHETEDCACWRTCCALKTLNIEAQPRSSTKCMCLVVFAHHLKQTYTNRTAWLRGAGCLQWFSVLHMPCLSGMPGTCGFEKQLWKAAVYLSNFLCSRNNWTLFSHLLKACWRLKQIIKPILNRTYSFYKQQHHSCSYKHMQGQTPPPQIMTALSQTPRFKPPATQRMIFIKVQARARQDQIWMSL